jgi:hypothetical protein
MQQRTLGSMTAEIDAYNPEITVRRAVCRKKARRQGAGGGLRVDLWSALSARWV